MSPWTLTTIKASYISTKMKITTSQKSNGNMERSPMTVNLWSAVVETLNQSEKYCRPRPALQLDQYELIQEQGHQSAT